MFNINNCECEFSKTPVNTRLKVHGNENTRMHMYGLTSQMLSNDPRLYSAYITMTN